MKSFYNIEIYNTNPQKGCCSGAGMYEEGSTARLFASPASSDLQAVWKTKDSTIYGNFIFINDIQKDMSIMLDFVPKNDFPIHIDYN